MGLSRWWRDRLLGLAVVWCGLGDVFGAQGGLVDSLLVVLSLVVLHLGGFDLCHGQVVVARMSGVGEDGDWRVG